MAPAQSKPASPDFIICAEIIDLVVRHCSWFEVVQLSNVNSRFRAVVFSVIRIRLRSFLGLFIPDNRKTMFLDLMERTDAAIVGSLVRCLMMFNAYPTYLRVHPLQLNIVIPFRPQKTTSENGTKEYKKWRNHLISCGYKDEFGCGDNVAPYHLTAASSYWSVMKNSGFPDLRVSLLQSKTSSPLKPILQAAHSSSFFALSPTRIYCMYPKLFAAKVSVSMRDRMPILKCAFDSFNFGMTSFADTDDWGVFRNHGCGEACPSVWRNIRGLKGVGVFRWGGFRGDKDAGDVVSAKDNHGDEDGIWRVNGECANMRCPASAVCTDLFQRII